MGTKRGHMIAKVDHVNKAIGDMLQIRYQQT